MASRNAPKLDAVVVAEPHQNIDKHRLCFLCPSGERPRCGRTANECDELAPLHCLPRGSGQVSTQTSTLEGVGRGVSLCPLWVDTVEKRFCGPECATLIQNRGRVRNFDSNTLLFGFDCCVWADR